MSFQSALNAIIDWLRNLLGRTKLPPVADFSLSPQTGVAPLTVSFDASSSYGSNGSVAAYAWDFGDGHQAMGALVSHTYTDFGQYTITLTVTGSRGKTGSKSSNLVVQRQPQQPPIASFTLSPASGIVPLEVSFDASSSIAPGGTIERYQWDFGDGGQGSGATTTHTYATDGTYTATLTVTDSLGATTSTSQTLEVSSDISAPLIEQVVATDLAGATEFLYKGENAVQTGVIEGTIQAQQVAILRGEVTDVDGQPLSGVKVTVVGHSEFGQTRSQSDGTFNLAANGGMPLTLRYEKDGFPSVQRQVQVPWRDYVNVPTVVMIAYDNQVTPVDLSSTTPIQVAQSSVSQDSDGDRQAKLLIPQGTQAELVMADGTQQPLTNISVRATEYTVGDNGPARMPAELPPSSGYTYCLEYSLDEAIAAGAKDVEFNQPLIHYVENFLGFPVGGIVPVGYYDREAAVWKASENGRIIQILSVANGLAELDVDGSGEPANADALAELNITDAERQQLASSYQPDQSLWRVSIQHFTPWDCNWPYGPPDDAEAPNTRDPNGDEREPDSCSTGGSQIDIQNQVLGESLPIAGTPFSLVYQSDRVRGRSASFQLEIPLTGDQLAESVRSIELKVEVAGRQFTQSFAVTPNLSHTFTWDGKDAYGRLVQGEQPVAVQVGYTYQAVYRQPAEVGSAFALLSASGIPVTSNNSRDQLTLWKVWMGLIGCWDAKVQGYGGWGFSAHHSYDPTSRVLYTGDGGQRRAADLNQVITTVVGNGITGYDGDDGPATSARINSLRGLAVTSDGSLYIASAGIRKVKDGIISSVLPQQERYQIEDIAYGADGNIYFISGSRVFQIGSDGQRTVVAGSNENVPYDLEGVSATNVRLDRPRGITSGADGSIYISETWRHRIRRIDPSGIITTIAGNGTAGFSGDGGPARQAQLNSPYGLTTGADGSLYFADTRNHCIRCITPDGTIWRVAGNRQRSVAEAGVQATGTRLSFPTGIALTADNTLYITEGRISVNEAGYNRLYKVVNPVRGTAYSESQNVPGMKTLVYYQNRFFHVFNDNSEGYSITYLRTSEDGINWTPKVKVSDAPEGIGTSNSSLAVWERNGVLKIAVAWAINWTNQTRANPSQYHVSVSDGGAAFNPSVPVSQQEQGSFQGQATMRGSIAVGNDGVLYLAWVERKQTFYNNWEVMFSKSSDDGNTWTTPKSLQEKSENCVVIAGESQQVLVAATEKSVASNIVLYHSTDGGVTWTRSNTTSYRTSLSGTQSFSLALSPDGTLNAIWLFQNFRYGGVWKQVMFAKLPLGQTTWSTPQPISERILDASLNDFGTLSLAVGNNGESLYAIWSDDRRRLATKLPTYAGQGPDYNGFRDIYVRASQDGGNTWSESDIRMSPLGNGVQHQPALAVKPGANRQDEVLVVWVDARLGFGKLSQRLLTQFDSSIEPNEPPGEDGTIYVMTRVGKSGHGFSGDGFPAAQAQFKYPFGLAVAPNGDLYISDTDNNRVRKIASPLSGFSGSDIGIPSEDGSELYQFTAVGQHLRTINTLTGTTLYEFGYDPKGLLTSVTDGDGSVTQIERNPEGIVQAIISPYGHRTTLALNGDGYLEQLTDPAGSAYQFAYKDQGGLLETMTDPRENIYRFTYEDSGRLQEDADPAGGTKLITRTRNGSDTTVRLVTAMLRETTYRTERLPSGDKRMESRCCGGDSAVMIVGQDGSRSLRQPDGTGIRTETGPDPRWGMQAPLVTKQTITTPKGLSTTIERQRNIAPNNDPQLWETLTETVTINPTINSKSYVSTYDKAAKLTTYRTPAGRVSTTKLDDQGRVVEAQIPGRLPVQVVYDSRGRVESMTQGDRTYTLTYDDKDNLQTVTDPLSQTTRFEYDPVGRVTKQIAPDGREATFTYDPNGNVDSITPPDRPAHRFEYTPVDLEAKYIPPSLNGEDYSTTYAYNQDRQLEEIQRPDGKTVSLGYDDAGLLRTIDIARGQIRLDYDEKTWNLKTATAPDGGKIEYEYDGSLPIETRWSGEVSGSVQWSYGNNLRLASQKVNNAYEVKYEYDDDGLLKKAGEMTLHRNPKTGQLRGTELGTVKDFYTYNGFGELETYRVEANGNELMNIAYRRDRLGRIEWKEETISGETHTYEYSYHPAGWLEKVTEDGVVTSQYEYDDNGNRRRHVTPSETTEATYDDQDRLLTYGNYRYTYTTNGELRTKTNTATNETITYAYDELGNLLEVTQSSSEKVEYLIDSESRRIGKKANGELKNIYLYEDDLNVVAEFSGSSRVSSQFVYASESNVPDYFLRGNNLYRIICDHLGSPRLVIDTQSLEAAQILKYDSFGNVLIDSNPKFQPFGFSGGILDSDTKKIRFGARDYDPENGRWAAIDPNYFDDSETTNLYIYAINDPMNFVDWDGLSHKLKKQSTGSRKRTKTKHDKGISRNQKEQNKSWRHPRKKPKGYPKNKPWPPGGSIYKNRAKGFISSPALRILSRASALLDAFIVGWGIGRCLDEMYGLGATALTWWGDFFADLFLDDD